MWKEKETDVVFEEVRDSKAEGKQIFKFFHWSVYQPIRYKFFI